MMTAADDDLIRTTPRPRRVRIAALLVLVGLVVIPLVGVIGAIDGYRSGKDLNACRDRLAEKIAAGEIGERLRNLTLEHPAIAAEPELQACLERFDLIGP